MAHWNQSVTNAPWSSQTEMPSKVV